jgi:hypothetical protein
MNGVWSGPWHFMFTRNIYNPMSCSCEKHCGGAWLKVLGLQIHEKRGRNPDPRERVYPPDTSAAISSLVYTNLCS